MSSDNLVDESKVIGSRGVRNLGWVKNCVISRCDIKAVGNFTNVFRERVTHEWKPNDKMALANAGRKRKAKLNQKQENEPTSDNESSGCSSISSNDSCESESNSDEDISDSEFFKQEDTMLFVDNESDGTSDGEDGNGNDNQKDPKTPAGIEFVNCDFASGY